MVTPETPTQLRLEPSAHSVLWGRFIAPFLSGDEPRIQHLALRRFDRLEDLTAAETTRIFTSSARSVMLAETEEWTLLAQSFGGGEGGGWVRAATDELVAKGIADLKSRLPEAPAAPDRIALDFWQVGKHGPAVTSRTIDAPKWADIAHHYPAEVRAKLDDLVHLDMEDISGRIALWHGPPGTGKTTAIRALARAWGSDRQLQILLDPEVIFARAATLMSVVLDDDADNKRWRVLVLEDADELLQADAKQRVGQALSRLLNLGDGILGQGLKVLVLITTNEPIRRLHPALVRPGRCLTEIEFRPFSRPEAQLGLGIDRGGTLADLLHGVESTSDIAAGQYL